jgi:hypothetical protein
VELREFQREVIRWRDLENLACAAEQELKAAGLLANSPEAAALVRDAFEKRRAADSCLLRLLRKDVPAAGEAQPSQTRSDEETG